MQLECESWKTEKWLPARLWPVRPLRMNRRQKWLILDHLGSWFYLYQNQMPAHRLDPPVPFPNWPFPKQFTGCSVQWKMDGKMMGPSSMVHRSYPYCWNLGLSSLRYTSIGLSLRCARCALENHHINHPLSGRVTKPTDLINKKRSYPVSPRYSKTGMINKVSGYLSSVKWSPISARVAVLSKVEAWGSQFCCTWPENLLGGYILCTIVGISVIWMAGRNSYHPKCQSSVVYRMGYTVWRDQIHRTNCYSNCSIVWTTPNSLAEFCPSIAV